MSNDTSPDSPIFRLPPYNVDRASFVRAMASEQSDWWIPSLGYDSPVTWPTGAGVKTGIADTGADLDHPDLKGAIDGSKDFTGSGTGGDDDNEHGSHVAGICGARRNDLGIYSPASECRLYIAKVLDRFGSGGDRGIEAGLLWLIEQGCRVINNSYGSPSGSERISQLMTWASEKPDNPVLFVCAAGNSGNAAGVDWPGRLFCNLATAATGKSKRVTSFSSGGVEVDVAAPGDQIYSLAPGGGYQKMSGTSMAAPVVTALAAQILEVDPTLTPKEIIEIITKTAVDIEAPGQDPLSGLGLIDPKAAIAEVQKRLVVPPPVGGPFDTIRTPLGDFHLPAQGGETVGFQFENKILGEQFKSSIILRSKK